MGDPIDDRSIVFPIGQPSPISFHRFPALLRRQFNGHEFGVTRSLSTHAIRGETTRGVVAVNGRKSKQKFRLVARPSTGRNDVGERVHRRRTKYESVRQCTSFLDFSFHSVSLSRLNVNLVTRPQKLYRGVRVRALRVRVDEFPDF